jgi:biofilm PGA synthesis N-glycosyltransferase PgaC
MTIYFLIVFGFYFLFLLLLLVGWRKAIRQTIQAATDHSDHKFISVVVAMRNEEANIENLLLSLSVQNYSPDKFEIILVDDHSEDGSEAEARKWLDRISSLKIIALDETEKGKKTALFKGISVAKGELIATTDADCVVPPNWLKRINETFKSEKTSLCVGTVALQNKNTFFSKLQSIEFASVMGTGISMAALGNPIMCNGANLSFRKKTFDEVGGYSGNDHIASGDDEFLMQKIRAKSPNSIHVVTDCVVVTKPQVSFERFIHQRLRWASKWKHNSSPLARLSATYIFVIQWSWLALIGLLVFYPSPIFVTLILSKVLLDLIVLSGTSRSLGMKFNLVAFAVLQFLYPFYVLHIGLFSQTRNHVWKGRRI